MRWVRGLASLFLVFVIGATAPPVSAAPAPAQGPVIVTGAGAGGGPHVRVFTENGTPTDTSFFAYAPAFKGGVYVAVGNVDGDANLEVVTGTGPGGGPHVRVFELDGTPVGGGFMAYDPAFRGGVHVAVGDVTGDGVAEIVTGPGPGGGPHVRVFSSSGSPLGGGFMAFDPANRNGVSIAAGNVQGGTPDEIVAASRDGQAVVRAFDSNGALRSEFSANGGGAYSVLHVAASGVGILLGPGDRATSARAGAAALKQYGLYAPGGQLQSEGDAYPGFGGAINVGFTSFNGTVRALTGAGKGGGPHIKVFDPANPGSPLASFMAYDPAFRGGVNVAGGFPPSTQSSGGSQTSG